MSDLYADKILGAGGEEVGYFEVLNRMESIDEALHGIKKKKKKGGKKGKAKKLKKQLVILQQENQQIKYLISALAAQQQHGGGKKKKKKKKQKQGISWWEMGLANSMPIVFNNLTRPEAQLLPRKSQLYLTDGSDKK